MLPLATLVKAPGVNVREDGRSGNILIKSTMLLTCCSIFNEIVGDARHQISNVFQAPFPNRLSVLQVKDRQASRALHTPRFLQIGINPGEKNSRRPGV